MSLSPCWAGPWQERKSGPCEVLEPEGSPTLSPHTQIPNSLLSVAIFCTSYKIHHRTIHQITSRCQTFIHAMPTASIYLLFCVSEFASAFKTEIKCHLLLEALDGSPIRPKELRVVPDGA